MQLCYASIGRPGGRYTALEPYPKFLHTRPSVKPDWVLGPSIMGKPIGWPPPFERDANEELREFGVKWCKTIQQLLDNGKLKSHPLRLMPGGLAGVPDGVELLRKKQISGAKLVYTVL
jgi:hypothetical protein